MSMSVKMKKSHARMLEHEKLLTAYDFKQSIRILHEDSSFYFLTNAIMVEDKEDKNYLWVFCEHNTDLIFHKGDLIDWSCYISEKMI
jgi:hypothetical protein